jgi:hypothetical protein
MVLIAGAAFGIWMVLKDIQSPDQARGPLRSDAVFLVVVGVLGGVSLVGPPLLLWRRRRREAWRAGRLIWFSQGMASWLLWPPVAARRARGEPGFQNSIAGSCWAYGTPLMAIYVVSALLAGGWLRRRRRRRERSWRERFGLLLGMAWACTGLYVLYMIYRDDFRR